MSEAKRQAIIVLGMHRSGTSALAGVLGMLGARLPAHMLPPQADNPKGYFEPERITAIHDRLLAAAGTSWYGLEPIADQWFDSAEVTPFAEELVSAVREDFGEADVFVIKDPRMCRLMPIWRGVFARIGAEPRFAINVRHPIEVARSLEKRNQLPLKYGCLLWLRYVLDAERQTRGAPRVFERYEDLLRDSLREAEGVIEKLAIKGLVANKSSEDAVRSFIDPAMRHHIAENEHAPRLLDGLADAYEALEDFVRRPADEAAQRRLDEVRNRFDPRVPSYSTLLSGDPRDEKIVDLEDSLSRLEDKLSAQSEEMVRLRKEMIGREASPNERDAKIAPLEDKLSAQSKEMVRLREEMIGREASLNERDAKIASLNNALAGHGNELLALRAALPERDARIAGLNATIAEIHSSHSWQLTAPVRFVGRHARSARDIGRGIHAVLRQYGVNGAVAKARSVWRRKGLTGVKGALLRLSPDGLQSEEQRVYAEWVRNYDILNDEIRGKIRAHIERMSYKPLISVVMPVYNPEPKYLDQTIKSVRAQLYPHWELCIADDASTNRRVRRVIDQHRREDARIKAVYRQSNGHISRATNSALELATGEFIAFVDHDDLVPEHAFYWVAAELNTHPQADLVYSDSDFVDDAGQRRGPYFKPDFDLELMLGHNMINHLGVYRRSLVEAVGGMRVGFEGAQDYDLALRIISRSSLDRVRHIPAVLYHWRQSEKAPSYSAQHLDRCIKAAQAAVREFLTERGVHAEVLPAPAAPNWQRVRYQLPSPAPTVSAIVPTKNQADLLRTCMRGLLQETDYPSLQIAIVDHESDDPATRALLAELATDRRVRILPYSGPFNFSAINNFAVKNTDGDIVAFLNNDIEVMHSDWLREMVSRAAQPRVGAVGAKLYYPSGNIQHAGVTVGIGGVAGHHYCHMPHNFPGRTGETILARELSAVTAACMVVGRRAFNEVGGFDAVNLAVAFNDVDFCLRLRQHGYRNVFTPFAELIHHESASRGSDELPGKRERFQKEAEYMMAHWGKVLTQDPYFNPNFSLLTTHVELARPPRVLRPWDGEAASSTGHER